MFNTFNDELISIDYGEIIEAEIVSSNDFSSSSSSFQDSRDNLVDTKAFSSSDSKWVSKYDENILPNVKLKKLDKRFYRGLKNSKSKIIKANQDKSSVRHWIPGAR